MQKVEGVTLIPNHTSRLSGVVTTLKLRVEEDKYSGGGM